MILEILSMGSGLALQDQGRMGWRRFGVPAGGAVDQRSMHIANALLGNHPNAPVLEITQLGSSFRILRDCWLSIAGGDFCSDLDSGSARAFKKGDILEIKQPSDGLYTYLAVPGGFNSDLWLGSASSDYRNGMGLRLIKGVQLNSMLLEPKISIERVGRRLSTRSQTLLAHEEAHFELLHGPQSKLFDRATKQTFIENSWTVSTRSDRTGYRLEGPKLDVPDSIPSEPILPGSFQVPGNGQAIVTMHDGPTVGGYAKIAVIQSADLDRFAQCAPGTQLIFSWAHSS